MSSTTSTYFCVLTIRKQLPEMRFERSGRGQEPSRGHKFSILENFLSIRDFTSAMRLHFRSDLVGVALVGATPLHLLSQTALPLKSPTGAFIAALRSANAVAPNAKYQIILPLNMARAQRKPFQIVLSPNKNSRPAGCRAGEESFLGIIQQTAGWTGSGRRYRAAGQRCSCRRSPGALPTG